MINAYDKLDISKWYELDTTHCFMGTKKPKFNKHCVYDIFAGYCDLDRFQLKEKVTVEVSENMQWYDRVGRVYFGWKDSDLSYWLKKQKYKNNSPDEFCIYVLSVLFRRHTIIYTMFQPWCTIDIKPGMHPEFVEEACETKLVYLGSTLFGELRRKPLTMLPWPQVNIDEIQAARVLHRDANLMEMYIEHAASTELNISNLNIVRNVETFISPSDTTTILPTTKTVFDTDYLPESKVEPDVLDQNMMFTITESMGSALGEISFPSTIKDEPTDTVGQVLTTHSPTCELRCGLENKLQTMLNTRCDGMEPESSLTTEYSSQTMEYSSDETILVTPPRPTVDGQNLQDSRTVLQDIMPDQLDSCDHGVRVEGEVSVDCSNSQDITNTESCLQDITHDANVEICSQDVNPVCSQDVNPVCSQDVTDIVTDIVIDEVGLQDISQISNELYDQQDAPITGLQQVTNNSGTISELGDSHDVISICPEKTFTSVSLEPQTAPSHTSNGLTIKQR